MDPERNETNANQQRDPQHPAWLIAAASVVSDFKVDGGQSTPQAIEVKVDEGGNVVGKTEIHRP